jgi:8-oxo-dGTP diphosphatase
MSAPSGSPASGRLVVGAAILDGAGRLLAAQRGSPARYAGRWEFPGGKVEAGESPVDALIRECREELGIGIAVGEVVGEVSLDIGRLRVYLAGITDGQPVARVHTALRWLEPSDLDDVEWIDADRPLVERLRAFRRPRG